MKVLHLPINIASQISVTVQALRDLGVEARGLVRNNATIQSTEAIEDFPLTATRRQPARFVGQRMGWLKAYGEAIRWADVVHWHFGLQTLPMELDLRMLERLDKPRVVEFWGSDVRIPEVATRDNPYFAEVYRGWPELYEGAAERSLRTQMAFGRRGFVCLAPDADMRSYIHGDLFRDVRMTRARISTARFEPRYPDPGCRRPVVAHMPSKKALKGTASIVAAVEVLQRRLDFDFVLIHGVPHAEAMALLAGCDVFIDEVVSGAYGLAALEAMSLGKPTVVYLKEAMVKSYPPENPIVNARQEDLVEVLEGLLTDGPRRHALGRQARAYAQARHDALVVGRQLIELYEELARTWHHGRA